MIEAELLSAEQLEQYRNGMSPLAHLNGCIPLLNHIAAIEAQQRTDRWRCFHCGFETTDRIEAAGHFGDGDDEGPLCSVWVKLDADGRASEFQNIYGQLQEEFKERMALEARLEEAKRALEQIGQHLVNAEEGKAVVVLAKALASLPASPKWLECVRVVISEYKRNDWSFGNVASTKMTRALDRLTEAMKGTK